MTFADSNRASIRYIPEATTDWGVTPANGVTRPVRFTSSSLTANKETTVSDELRADRMVSSVPEVSASSEGEINFELSAGSQDDFLQAFVLGAWTRPMTFDYFKGVTVSWTANNKIKIAGIDATSYFEAGRRIKTEGFAVNAVNNGYFEIDSIALVGSDTEITVTTTTSVIEGSSPYTKVLDANDVFVLNNSDIRLGTGGASTIDSNSNDAFASAIAAGQLTTGQMIFVDMPVSAITSDNFTITFTGTGADGDRITFNDGLNVLLLEAGVDYTTGADETATATSLALAINRKRAGGNLNMKATSAAGVVTVYVLSNASNSAIAESVDGNSEIAVSAKTTATNPSARGFYKVTGLTDDVIDVTPTPPTVASPGAVTVKGSMLRNPGDVADITPQSFTLEQSFNDVDKHFIQSGMRAGSFSLEVTTGSIVTGAINFMGKETLPLTSTQLGAAPYTPLESTATEVMNATTNVGNLTKNGEVLSTAVESLTLEGDASLRNQNAVGFKFARGIGTGRFNLTGSLTAYFEDMVMYNHFINHDTISIGFDFKDQDANVYYWTIPALKITSDPIAPGGIDQDVKEEMEWSALRDPATACMLQIDRFSSTNMS
ncbi:MAG: phage tail tube protein [Hoeflea sp.]|uniref:phage tail tube protein n=1 Tax=Hoeflea sp. TaxID=1940281 RepID=UPI0032ED38E6